MSSDEPDLLAAAYALDGPDASRALYARWADTYESGFIAETRYVYHDEVAAVFAARWRTDLDAGGAVVDVGCGTGLAGAAVVRLVEVTVDGLDISPEMLAQAARKRHDSRPVYRRLLTADLTRPLDLPTASYAGAVSVGTFTHGHVGAEALGEVLRIVRPGGLCAIGINAAHFASAGFGDAFDGFVHDGRIDRLELVEVPIYDGADMADPDQFGRVATFRISPPPSP